MATNRALTMKDVAERLQVSEMTVRRLRDQRKIRGFYIGVLWRCTEENFQEYLNSKEELAKN